MEGRYLTHSEPTVLLQELNTFNELLKLVLDGAYHEGFIWRGESSSQYKLLPSALRPENTNELALLAFEELSLRTESHSETEFKQIRLERIILQKFLRLADMRGLMVPKTENLRIVTPYTDSDSDSYSNWIHPDLHDIAALAQHYGVYTRLLDWTYDFFTALYFASMGAIKRFEKLKYNYCNEQRLDEKDKLVIYALHYTHIDPFREVDSLKIIKPPYFGNPNLAAQAGVFTLFVNDDCLLNDKTPINRTTLDELLDGKYKIRVLTKFSIPITERYNIYSFLIKMKWDASKLFPGYGGVKRALEETSIFQRQVKHSQIRLQNIFI